MPESVQTVAEELRLIARANTLDLVGIAPEDTMEWRSAGLLETAARALHEIEAGAPDPRAVATVALLAMGEPMPRDNGDGASCPRPASE